jgi:hypothetical protein
MPPRPPLVISHGELEKMIEISINCEDSALQRWLDPMTRQSIKYGFVDLRIAYAFKIEIRCEIS